VGWYHHGDRVVVCDARKDGLSIEANHRHAGDQGPGRVVHDAGAGNCDTEARDTHEGANIQTGMCYRDGVIVTECSDWQNAEA
jgi:hypothetical protein